MKIPTPLALTLTALFVACGGEAVEETPPSDAAAASEAPSSPDDSDVANVASTLLDPNEAGRDALLAVEGLDEEAVDALIGGRPYVDMLEVDAALAEHLDSASREVVYASVWKPLDLNAASGDEILLIPGVGERMEHEFEEYRPYRAMAEFHREIGKYVDEEEVRRLAMYVELR